MDQVRWSLGPDARRRLVAANRGFDAESQWAELELWVGFAVMAERLSAPAKVCRADLAAVIRAAEQLDTALAGLHAPTCNALWATLLRVRKMGSWLPQLSQDLGVLSSVAREARDSIPGHGGRAPLELRKAAILWTSLWVDRLQPLRARAAVEGAIERSNARKDLKLLAPLPLSEDDIDQRRLKSIKIVLAELGLPTGSDLRAIVRRALAKKPT
jgi:hypothetical protein